MSTTYTRALDPLQAEALRQLLLAQNFDMGSKEHALYHGKKDKLSVTVYHKGPKVLIQGKATEDFVRYTLEPEILGTAELDYHQHHHPEQYQPHFGIDESGKGDLFGPLVVAGVYTDQDLTPQLLDFGVCDSKRITSDKKIRDLAEKIRSLPGIAHSTLSLTPETYNRLYQDFGNLNAMLAWAHACVIERLLKKKPDCPRSLSDQFSRRTGLIPHALQARIGPHFLEIQQRTKAESDVAVAAASILARESFIDWLDKTSKKLDIVLFKGVSQQVIDSGRTFVQKQGKESLPLIAKMHFKTLAKLSD